MGQLIVFTIILAFCLAMQANHYQGWLDDLRGHLAYERKQRRHAEEQLQIYTGAIVEAHIEGEYGPN